MTSSDRLNDPDPAGLRQVADLPAPKGLPLIGNVHQLPPKQLTQTLERWRRELGAPYRVRILSRDVLVIDDPEQAQRMARERPYRFRRAQPMESLWKDIGANGVFSTEGAAWEPQRRLVMQALSVPQIRAVYPTLHAIGKRLHARWLRAAKEKRVIDMIDDLKRYTVDVTSALAFGEDPRTLEREGGVIQEHLDMILPMLNARMNLPFPYWRYVRLPRDRKLDRSLVEVHRYVRRMMERAREQMRDDRPETPRNLLEAMLAIRDTPESEISDEQVVANVLTLLLAGEDTTSHSIAWSIPFIAGDPRLQQRMADEARKVLRGEPVCPDYATLKELDLFEAVCTETGRFRPVASLMGFEPVEDITLGDIRVPADTTIVYLVRPPMLEAGNFVNPERFDPDRWILPRTTDRAGHDPRASFQFGAGPRVCPGRHLAGVEMRVALSMLLANFEVELAIDPSEIREVNAFTLVPSSMPVKLKIRS